MISIRQLYECWMMRTLRAANSPRHNKGRTSLVHPRLAYFVPL